MDARTLAQAIISDDRNCSILTNDAGNGCAGPSNITADELQGLLDSGEIDEYAIIPDPGTIIADTIAAHGMDLDPSEIILAERVEDSNGGNPYRQYLLLWMV